MKLYMHPVSMVCRPVRLLKAMACLVFSCTYASAATYYVSINGADGNDGQLPASAWRTIAKVNAFPLQPGDIVLFQGSGVWHEMLAPSTNGTPAQPIVFSTFGEGYAVLNGSDNATGYAGIVASKSDHKFSNFEVKNHMSGRISVYIAGAARNSFDNLYVHDGAVGFLATNARSSSDITITNSRLLNFDNGNGGGYAIGVAPSNSNWNVSNVEAGNALDSCIWDSGTSSVYDRMNVHDCGFSPTITVGTHGLYMKGPRKTVSNSTVFHTRDSCITVRRDGAIVSGNRLDGCQIGISFFEETIVNSAMTMTRNTITNTDTGIYLNDSQYSTFNVSNNTVQQSRMGINAHSGKALRLENNVFATTTYTKYFNTSTNIPLAIGSYSGGYLERNNLFYSDSRFYAPLHPVYSVPGRWVNFATYKSLTGQGSNTIDGGSPQLDVSGIPLLGSPAIDAGTGNPAAGPILPGCNGITTYCGAAPDMGAKESPF